MTAILAHSAAPTRIAHKPWCEVADHESDEVAEMFGGNARCSSPFVAITLSNGTGLSGYLAEVNGQDDPVVAVEFPLPGGAAALTMEDLATLAAFTSGLLALVTPAPAGIPSPRCGQVASATA